MCVVFEGFVFVFEGDYALEAGVHLMILVSDDLKR